MYSGLTISDFPKQVTGELYSSENAETYIEYTQNGTTTREEVLPGSIKRLEVNNSSTVAPSILAK